MTWNSTLDHLTDGEEVECHRCYGSGEDDEGAACIHCDGFGTILV